MRYKIVYTFSISNILGLIRKPVKPLGKKPSIYSLEIFPPGLALR